MVVRNRSGIRLVVGNCYGDRLIRCCGGCQGCIGSRGAMVTSRSGHFRGIESTDEEVRVIECIGDIVRSAGDHKKIDSPAAASAIALTWLSGLVAPRK